MKLLLYVLVLSLISMQLSFGQAPGKFSFQGVARNAEGKLVGNRDVSIRISIRPETALGNPVYQETHTTKTNANGIFNIAIGGGAGLSGQFSEIDWKSGKYFLQMEMDQDGGSNYIDLGATQLLSVPYALHAEEASKVETALHSLNADQAERWKDNDPVVQRGTASQGGGLSVTQNENYISSINETYLIWYPRKGAFRTGSAGNSVNAFNDANIGIRSFATAMDMIAKGFGSIAMGYGVSALGNKSAVIGSSSTSSGEGSIALGEHNQSLGQNLISLGYNLHSKSRFGLVFGMYNDDSDEVSDDISPTQRLFQIGNGNVSTSTKKNAMTILRNGNVGIGSNVLEPTHILDVGQRMRLRQHANATAGLWLDDSANQPYSFIGGYDDDEAGIYFNDGSWRFIVNKNGGAWLAGTLKQNSDLRLKQDLQTLSGSLDKLYELKGYHYHWKDKTRSQALQTGLIAQEVEAIFPELVETDKDGFKSVNYIGLIPHLLEAVKELKNENAALRKDNKAISEETKRWEMLEKKMEQIEARLNEYNKPN